MRLIDADDLYQKCIEIQLKKRDRYFDIDDVMKLIKKAPTVDVLDLIRAEIINKSNEPNYLHENEDWSVGLEMALEIIDKHIGERRTKYERLQGHDQRHDLPRYEV